MSRQHLWSSEKSTDFWQCRSIAIVHWLMSYWEIRRPETLPKSHTQSDYPDTDYPINPQCKARKQKYKFWKSMVWLNRESKIIYHSINSATVSGIDAVAELIEWRSSVRADVVAELIELSPSVRDIWSSIPDWVKPLTSKSFTGCFAFRINRIGLYIYIYRYIWIVITLLSHVISSVVSCPPISACISLRLHLGDSNCYSFGSFLGLHIRF